MRDISVLGDDEAREELREIADRRSFGVAHAQKIGILRSRDAKHKARQSRQSRNQKSHAPINRRDPARQSRNRNAGL